MGLVDVVFGWNFVMIARVMEQRAKLDFCEPELGLVDDETDVFGLFSGTGRWLVEDGFLPELFVPGAALARAECRRDNDSFGLSVPFVLVDRADEIEDWLV